MTLPKHKTVDYNDTLMCTRQQRDHQGRTLLTQGKIYTIIAADMDNIAVIDNYKQKLTLSKHRARDTYWNKWFNVKNISYTENIEPTTMMA